MRFLLFIAVFVLCGCASTNYNEQMAKGVAQIVKAKVGDYDDHYTGRKNAQAVAQAISNGRNPRYWLEYYFVTGKTDAGEPIHDYRARDVSDAVVVKRIYENMTGSDLCETDCLWLANFIVHVYTQDADNKEECSISKADYFEYLYKELK